MRRTVPAWTLAVMFVSSLVLSFAIAWIGVRLSERKWCDLITTLDEGYSAPVPGAPPPSERGKKIGQDIHELRVAKLHC